MQQTDDKIVRVGLVVGLEVNVDAISLLGLSDDTPVAEVDPLAVEQRGSAEQPGVADGKDLPLYISRST